MTRVAPHQDLVGHGDLSPRVRNQIHRQIILPNAHAPGLQHLRKTRNLLRRSVTTERPPPATNAANARSAGPTSGPLPAPQGPDNPHRVSVPQIHGFHGEPASLQVLPQVGQPLRRRVRHRALPCPVANRPVARTPEVTVASAVVNASSPRKTHRGVRGATPSSCRAPGRCAPRRRTRRRPPTRAAH